MSDEIKGKKPRIKLPKTIITGLILSSVVWILIFAFLAYCVKAGGDNITSRVGVKLLTFGVIGCVLAIILGTIGYAVVSWFYTWLNNNIMRLTINPIRDLIYMYIIHPLIGIIALPTIIFCLIYMISTMKSA